MTLIEGDRNNLGDKLKGYEFDVVLDITAYTREHVENLVNALGKFRDYIMISSSAVYPETNPQPFTEEQQCGPNSIWGIYGTNKLAAEEYLQKAPTSCARRTSTAPCRMCIGSLLFLNVPKQDGDFIFPVMVV